MIYELKRCPFCGMLPKTKVTAAKFGWDENHVDFTVCCDTCGIGKTVRLKIVRYVEFSDVDIAKEKAIDAWNQSVAVFQ